MPKLRRTPATSFDTQVALFWEIAGSTPVVPDDSFRHARHLDSGRADTNAVIGVITARSHATGWFVGARHRTDASAAEVRTFVEFVRLRVYNLLRTGPCDAGWTPAGEGTWQLHCAMRLPLDAPAIPDVVPPHWLDQAC